MTGEDFGGFARPAGDGLIEEILDDVAARLAHDRRWSDQDRHAAPSVGAHLRTGEGSDGGDVAQRRRAAHDVLKNGFPGSITEVEFDLDIVRGYAGELLDDDGDGGVVGTVIRLREGGLDRGAIEPDHVGRLFVGVEIKAFAVGLGLENMAEQKTFERRDIGDGYCRLNHGWGEVVGHGKISESVGLSELIRADPARRSL